MTEGARADRGNDAIEAPHPMIYLSATRSKEFEQQVNEFSSGCP